MPVHAVFKEEGDEEQVLIQATSSFKPPFLSTRRRLGNAKTVAAFAPAAAQGGEDKTDAGAVSRFSETATFGLGCFWGAEAAFSAHLSQVSDPQSIGSGGGGGGITCVGYTGGDDQKRETNSGGGGG
jgi:hypothetical protein